MWFGEGGNKVKRGKAEVRQDVECEAQDRRKTGRPQSSFMNVVKEDMRRVCVTKEDINIGSDGYLKGAAVKGRGSRC